MCFEVFFMHVFWNVMIMGFRMFVLVLGSLFFMGFRVFHK